jgi:hypothetical protein
MPKQCQTLLFTLAATSALLLMASGAAAQRSDLFTLRGQAGAVVQTGSSNNLIDLLEDFATLDSLGGFGGLRGLSGVTGTLSYLGVPNAILLNLSDTGTQITLVIPNTGTRQVLSAASPAALSQTVEDWIQANGSTQWADFLQAMNGLAPLAVVSGNPKSTVALMGDSAYRKFGFDDSRSRMGFGETIKRWGGFELRLDGGFSTVSTSQFSDDLWTFDPQLTLAGEFGRHVGLSFSVVGQYRSYDGAQLADLGLELALPITLMRPDRGRFFWQLTPFIQAAAGISIDFAAGGLFMGVGGVNALGWNRGDFEVLMSNEIAYYGGIPIDDISGYSFDTQLSQLLFKNGLEGTWWMGVGFYADAGIHFTNFAVDQAAVSWYATPALGIGWQGGRWFDVRLAYEAELGENDYVSHNLQAKLDFLF